MTQMRITVLTAALLAAAPLLAQQPVNTPLLSLVEGMMNVEMNMDLRALGVRSNETALLTPMLVNGTDTLRLQPVAVCGRNRWIQWQRGNTGGIPADADVMKASRVTDNYRYSVTAPWTDALDGASLSVRLERTGCAGCREGLPVEVSDLQVWRSPKLTLDYDMLAYVSPEVPAVKSREISARAYVEFPVGSTVLSEDFRNNFRELETVRRSIDSVRNDKDVTVTSIAIEGFASPEGSWQLNERLAKGRTEALARYVEQLCNLTRGFVKTSWTAEDWAGLRQWVEQSSIARKEALLAVIDNTSLTPDQKDARLKTAFPEDYPFLLGTVYPTLRRSDYHIEYTVRKYSDPAEILEVMKTRPGNLTLDELYLAARSLKPGSPEFREVYEVAVRLFPDDPVANLNAANTALLVRDTEKAEAYLAKAGDTPQARYAHGVCELVKGNLDAAQPLLEEAKASGIAGAAPLLLKLEALRAFEQARRQ